MPSAGEFPHDTENLSHEFRVERRGDLVAKQRDRLHRQRPCDGTRAAAGRRTVRRERHQYSVAEADALEHLAGHGFGFGLGVVLTTICDSTTLPARPGSTRKQILNCWKIVPTFNRNALRWSSSGSS